MSKVFTYFLFIWAVAIICYLLLELQRAIRLHIQTNKKQTAISENKLVSYYIKEIGLVLIAGKVKGNFSHPLELWEQIETNFSDIEQEEYERMIKLVQKARFGGIVLKPHEMYTLECFVKHLKKALYEKQNFVGKIRLRYIKTI